MMDDGKSLLQPQILGIDVALDSFLGRSISSLLKEGGKIGFKNILKSSKKMALQKVLLK